LNDAEAAGRSTGGIGVRAKVAVLLNAERRAGLPLPGAIFGKADVLVDEVGVIKDIGNYPLTSR